MLNLIGPEAHCTLKLPPKPKQGYRNMWAGANVDRAVRPRGELLEQQRHQLQRQKRELEATQQEVDRLVAEVEVLKKRKREQDQGSDNITVASSQ